MTVNHFIILIKLMWKKDWHQYKNGRILVHDHAAYMLLIYSLGRVGEYFECSICRGSGRGLIYEGSGLTLKKVVKNYTNVLSRQWTSLFSKMQKERWRLECGSRQMQKTFRRRCTKKLLWHLRAFKQEQSLLTLPVDFSPQHGMNV